MIYDSPGIISKLGIPVIIAGMGHPRSHREKVASGGCLHPGQHIGLSLMTMELLVCRLQELSGAPG